MRMPRPWRRPSSRSCIASLMASSGYVDVCNVTLPCAVNVIRSSRSTYVPTRLPMNEISRLMMSIVGTLTFWPYPITLA